MGLSVSIYNLQIICPSRATNLINHAYIMQLPKILKILGLQEFLDRRTHGDSQDSVVKVSLHRNGNPN